MTWPYQYTPYVWPMLVSAAFMWTLAAHALRHRSTPGVLPFIFGTLTMGLWALGAAGEVAAADFPTKLFWFRVQNMSGLPVVICILCFAMEYSSLGGWLSRRTVALLAAPAVAVPLLYFVDDARFLDSRIWAEATIHRVLAPVGMALNLYGMALILLATAVMVVLYVRSPLLRKPAILILLGHFWPSITYPLETLNVVADSPLDLTVLAADFSFLMYVIVIYRFRIFDVVPLARGTVLDRMSDGMLVVDARNRIADLNPAAGEMLGIVRSSLIGLDVTRASERFPDLLRPVLDPGPAETEISMGVPEGRRWFRVSRSVLTDQRGFHLASLFVFHDITELKCAQEKLLRQERALATVQERERVARELHDGVGQVLGYVSLQAEATRRLLADGKVAVADAQLARLARVAVDAHADVREDILSLKAAPREQPFFPALGRYLEGFSQNYGVQASLAVPQGLEDGAFDPEARAQLFRIIQEALSNARKHGNARHVSVSFETRDRQAQVMVLDDGLGFDSASPLNGDGRHFGLQFMRERAEQVGGSVDLHSSPGQGTRLIVQLPLSRATVD